MIAIFVCVDGREVGPSAGAPAKRQVGHRGRLRPDSPDYFHPTWRETLLLPEDAEADKIEAKVEKGVLNVHIPKKEQIRKVDDVKQIAIQ